MTTSEKIANVIGGVLLVSFVWTILDPLLRALLAVLLAAGRAL